MIREKLYELKSDSSKAKGIKGKEDGGMDYRRKRSLKFRAKQREWRKRVFQAPFHRKDRSKNMNKVSAAKRRKRDRTGKFNLEDESPDSNEN